MVILLLLFTKASGLYRDLSIIFVYGTNSFSDGYFLALSLVLSLYALIGKGITLFLMPILSGGDEDYEIISSFVLKALMVVIPIILFYWMIPEIVMSLFYIGDVYKVKKFFDIAIGTLVLVPILYALIAFHQKRERFYITTLLGLVFNLSIIIIVFIDIPIAVPYSFLVATMLQIGLLLGYRFDIKKITILKPDLRLTNQLGTLFYVVFTVAFEQLLVIVDRTSISQFGEGKLSMLDLGGKFSFMFMGIIVLGLTTVLYPNLTKLYHQGNKQEAIKVLRYCSLLLVILSIGFVSLVQWKGNWLLSLIFQTKAINHNEIGMYLQYYSLAIIPLGIREMMMRLLILEKREKQLAIYSGIGLSCNWAISSLAQTGKGVMLGTLVGITLCTIFTGWDYYRQVRLISYESH